MADTVVLSLSISRSSFLVVMYKSFLLSSSIIKVVFKLYQVHGWKSEQFMTQKLLCIIMFHCLFEAFSHCNDFFATTTLFFQLLYFFSQKNFLFKN